MDNLTDKQAKLNDLTAAMEGFLLSCGYEKIKGSRAGFKGKWKLPSRRGIDSGSVFFLKAAVDFELNWRKYW